MFLCPIHSRPQTLTHKKRKRKRKSKEWEHRGETTPRNFLSFIWLMVVDSVMTGLVGFGQQLSLGECYCHVVALLYLTERPLEMPVT
ncbi:hypothetical protein SESBI_37434 [Sesbania bispinosa]|nr:hypothetical protein SESBI_37434 [Sesbania bispinosa]